MSLFNVFDLLGAVDYFLAIPATLIRRDGSTLSFPVTTETAESASRGTSYGPTAFAVNLRIWSANRADLVDASGDIYKPQPGDVLQVADNAGTARRYVVTKDDASGAVGRWKHTRPGVRWIFYTRDDETR